MEKKITSTLPGLIYPSGRDTTFRTGKDFMDGRRMDDGAEGLWRINDKLYDLEEWMTKHPGGSEWLELTKGTDITEAFMTHHITEKPEKLLPKFYIRDAKTPRAIPLTFKPDGFYMTFKARAREALKDVDIHRPATKTNLIADAFFTTFVLSALLAAKTQSWLMIIIAVIFLTWTSVIGHNYVHMRDSFRMLYLDVTLLSSRDWRITHILSHHLYANTIWDHELYTNEPYIKWMPVKNKTMIQRYLAAIYSPLVYTMIYPTQAFRRYYTAIFQNEGLRFRDFVPFVIPLLMCTTAKSPLDAFGTWLTIILLSSFYHGLIGYNAAHHHPDIFHDGDTPRNELDWGLMSVDAVRDRTDIERSLFLVLTHFGHHTLHHLLPTVDHSYLSLCLPAFRKTCEEFGVEWRDWTQWKLLEGQFKQLSRTESKKNSR